MTGSRRDVTPAVVVVILAALLALATGSPVHGAAHRTGVGLEAASPVARPGSTAELPTRAVGTAQAEDPPRLDVVSQTTTVAPDGTFLLVLDVHDAPAGGRLDITFHKRPLQGRQAFSRSLFGVDLGDLTEKVNPVLLDDVEEVDGAKRVTIAIGLLRPGTPGPGVVSFRDGLIGPGAYPLEVRLFDGDERELTKVVTHLMRLPDAPDEDDPPTRPLRASVVVPLHAAPTVQPDGTADLPDDAVDSIADVVVAMEASTAPLTIRPTPETIEAMAREGERPGRLLDRLSRSLEGRELIDGPYVRLPIVSWLARGMDGELNQQRERGSRILTDQLEIPDATVWMAGSDTTTDAVNGLWQLGVRRLVLPAGSYAEPPRADDDPTVAWPFEVAAGGATMQALGVDSSLQAAFRRDTDPELAAYQLLAELSVIQQELPTDARGVVVPAPDDWVPSSAFLTTLLTELETHQLVRPVTLTELFEIVDPPTTGPDGEGPAPVTQRILTPFPGTSLGDYPEQLAQAAAQVESYAAMVGPSDPEPGQMRQRLLVSGDSDLTPAERNAYLVKVRQVIDRRVDGVETPPRQTVTLTAREGSVPLILRSTLDQPVDVILRIESGPQLEFPDGSEVAIRLSPGTRRVPIAVRARSPGDSPVVVRVLSPDGGITLASTRLSVRSTAISGLGFVLTGGAVAFLIVWWFRHVRLVRRAKREAASVEA